MSEAKKYEAMYTWLDVKDVAARLGVSVWAVRSLIGSKEMRAMNVGTRKRPHYKVSPDWLEDFMRRRTDG